MRPHWASTLLLLSVSAHSQGAEIAIPYTKFVLPNGLTVIVHEDRKAPIVAVNMWYHVGSKNERPGKTGFAHLFEHLMFGGSENAKGSYINALEKVGATGLNGTTNPDRTNYFQNVPTPALDYAMFLESDRMGHFINAFDKAVLDQQRGVVQNEKRQGENQPYGVTRQILTQNTYPPGHPYSWSTIGSMEDLSAASLEDVKEWFRTYYGPSNTVMVIAGDIDAKTAREKVEKFFGDIPAGPPVAKQKQWIAKMSGARRARVEDRVPQSRVYKVWNVPGFGTPESDYLDLVSDVLAQGKVSRLYKRLVYTEQLATEVFAFMNPLEIGGQFSIVASARPGVALASVEKAIDEELAKFLADGPTKEELERVQTQYTAGLLRGLERIGGFGGKSDILAQGQVYVGDPGYRVGISLQRHEKATAADLRKAAVDWLSDGVFVLEVHPFPQYQTASSKFDRSRAPEIAGKAELKLPRLQRAALSNGLKLVLAERHEIPVVNFWMLTDAGAAADPKGGAGTASLTSAMLTYGTKSLPALELDAKMESLGAQLNASSSADTSTVRLSALKKNLDASLALYADVILNPAFPAADFARQQRQRIAAIQREKAAPMGVAMRLMPQLLFGADHAYGAPETGTEAGVGKLTRDDLARFHGAWYKPNVSTIVVVGDTTLAEITPKLEQIFSSWKSGSVPAKRTPLVTPASAPRAFLIDKPGAQQSVILAGLLAPPKAGASDIPFEVMNVVLGGNFSGRLNMNLREDKHYAYGARSVIASTKGQRVYWAVSPVQTDKTKESLIEMRKELMEISQTRPVTEKELAEAKANQTLRLPGSRETMDEIGGSIANIIHYGLPDDYYQTFAARVNDLTVADLTDAAKSVIKPGQLVWVVVGDRAKIEAGVRELSLGEFKVLDADGREQ